MARLVSKVPAVTAACFALAVAASARGAELPPVFAPTGDWHRSLESPSTFIDGVRVEATRVGDLPGLTLPRGRRAVLLRYGDGAGVAASVDATAIVRIDATGEDDGRERLAALGLEPVRPLMASAGIWLARGGAAEDGLDLAVRFAPRSGHLGLRGVAPNLYLTHRLHQAAFPNDPDFSSQWYFAQLGMSAAWDLNRGDPSVSIAVVDTGCDLLHPDLKNKLDPGRDVVAATDDPSYVPGASGNYHGTACAGLVAASTNNRLGIAGTCPLCRMRCVRLLPADNEDVPVSADVDAFEFALKANVAVVSNSWGYSTAIRVPEALADAINKVADTGRSGKGALVLFAAGNENRRVEDYELLAVRGVIGVGAINRLDEPTQYTNYGASVDLVAYTGSVTTDISGLEGESQGDFTTTFGGTSSACPIVAGIAGLLVSEAPDWTAQQLGDVLKRTARRVALAQPDARGHDDVYGYGIVDPAAALADIRARRGGPDAGTPDAGDPEAPDAAVASGPAADSPGGCHCSSAGATAAESLAAVGALLAALGRRRRR